MNNVELSDRVARLEKRNGRLTILLVTSVMTGLTILFMGAGPRSSGDKGINASRFTLLDESGSKRAELSLQNGEPVLRMFDGTGSKPRVRLGMNESGSSSLQLTHKSGYGIAVLSAWEKAGKVEVGSRRRATLSYTEGNGSRLSLGHAKNGRMEMGNVGTQWTVLAWDGTGKVHELHRVP